MSKISDDLRAMKNLLATKGLDSEYRLWTKRRTLLSIGRESNRVGLLQHSSSEISEFTTGKRDGIVTTWNDEPGRTKQEVLDMLEDVAIKHDDDAMRSNTVTLSDDLNGVADYIDKYGWIQGDLGNPVIGVCALGGINRALSFDLHRTMAAQSALEEFLDTGSVSNWNDAKGRTKEEVIQALRDAAIKNQPDTMWG